MKFWQAGAITATIFFFVMLGIALSQSDRIESLESTIARVDSLEVYKQALVNRNNAIKAWQSTAYSMIKYNAGEIDADSMVTVLQFNFKPGSGIIDLWLRSIAPTESE